MQGIAVRKGAHFRMITGTLSIEITTTIIVPTTTGTGTGIRIAILPGILIMPTNSQASLGSIIEVIIMLSQIVLLL